MAKRGWLYTLRSWIANTDVKEERYRVIDAQRLQESAEGKLEVAERTIANLSIDIDTYKHDYEQVKKDWLKARAEIQRLSQENMEMNFWLHGPPESIRELNAKQEEA